MADENRTSSHFVELLRSLENEPYRFDFFQALRRLECLSPDSPRWGESAGPAEDPVRLGQEPSLAFAPSTLAGLERGKDGRPARLVIHFLGLLGPNGPLPLHLTEYARDRVRNADDPTFARFLDIFHHRMLSLFYRAWATAQPAVQLDRPTADRFADYVGSFLGIGESPFQHRDAVPDWAKLYYAGQFASQSHHARGLTAVIRDFFQLPGRVEEFAARWIDLPQDCRLRLGQSPQTGVLGETAVVGDRVWDCMQTFRIVLGPMPLKRLESFLPGGASRQCLDDFVRNYVGDELGWEIQLVLKKEEVPRSELGLAGRLGWTTWLASDSRKRDADDLILEPKRCAL